AKGAIAMSINSVTSSTGREFVVIDYAYGWGACLKHGWYIAEIVEGIAVVRFGCVEREIADDWMRAGGDDIAAHADHRMKFRPNGMTSGEDRPRGKAKRRAAKARRRAEPAQDVGRAAAERIEEEMATKS
ncbi:hypothetical protein R0K19_21105, partial [Bacillus sp. SIMBA_161]